MRVLERRVLSAAGLAPYQSFFVELWHSMTHTLSLDSYRVRCMNSRTIVREISDEIRLNIASDEELKHLCEELKAIIEADPVCGRHFKSFMTPLAPFLIDFPVRPKKKDGSKGIGDDNSDPATNRWDEFRFVIADLSVALEGTYSSEVCQDLVAAMIPDNEEEIRALTSSLLTDLLDHGWVLEALHTWHKKFLPSPGNMHSFDDNLKFMLEVFNLHLQDFEVTLKLRRTQGLSFARKLGGFTFSGTANENGQTGDFGESTYFWYSKIKVSDYDFQAAAQNARESFEQLTDLIRFDYERSPIEIDPLCRIKRMGDGKTMDFKTQHVTPNPAGNSTPQGFESFSNDLNSVLEKKVIDDRSKSQLQAAIRQYRVGRDSENYKDKLLYWWMGLEALTNTEHSAFKNIGKTVTHNTSRSMAITYLATLLDDFLATLRYCEIAWPPELVEISGVASVGDLSPPQLLTIIQSGARQKLVETLAKYPVLSYHGKALVDHLGSPASAAKHLESHLKHLEWHLERMYRIRCCIVHGTDIHFRLRLFAANLEYYLKRTIILCLNTFKRYDHITSLEELFRRAATTYDITIRSLKDQNATNEAVRQAVFASVPLIGGISRTIRS